MLFIEASKIGAWRRVEQQWIELFNRNPNASEAEIRAFLNDLKSVISDQSVAVDQMALPFL